LALIFAGLATVLLLLRSRSATPWQINLLQISEQLKTRTAGTSWDSGKSDHRRVPLLAANQDARQALSLVYNDVG